MLPKAWNTDPEVTYRAVHPRPAMDLEALDAVKFDGLSVAPDGAVKDGNDDEVDWPTTRNLLQDLIARIDRMVAAATGEGK